MTREEAIKLIDERMCFGRGKWSEHHMPKIDDYWKAGQMAIKALEQPERKMGKWIDAYPDIEPNPMFMYAICSVCGCEQAISNKLNFCPDCGSDMRQKEGESK